MLKFSGKSDPLETAWPQGLKELSGWNWSQHPPVYPPLCSRKGLRGSVCIEQAFRNDYLTEFQINPRRLMFWLNSRGHSAWLGGIYSNIPSSLPKAAKLSPAMKAHPFLTGAFKCTLRTWTTPLPKTVEQKKNF